jgi:hypothetical protein
MRRERNLDGDLVGKCNRQRLQLHPIHGLPHGALGFTRAAEETTSLEAQALSVRTFGLSKYYRNLVAITTEPGVYLICVPP